MHIRPYIVPAHRASVVLALALAATALPTHARAQGASKLPALAGTWQADTPDGSQRIVVRADSSASLGEEIVRWRLAGDTVYLALGGTWVGYTFTLRGNVLTLSGGDLVEPIRLRRVGPATPRPPGVAVPPPPAPAAARPGGG